jgi:hypothetical protein
MKWLAIVLGVAACTPCEGQRYVTDSVVMPAQLQHELAKCAGQQVCLDPCQDLFALTPDDELIACKVHLDGTGGGRVEATYIDWSVCSGDESVDDGGGYSDDGSWDTGDDGTPDDGSDSPPDDGTPDDGTPDDGTPDDGTPDDSTPDDGTPDDGATGRVAPAHHAWSTLAPRAPRM